MHRGIVIATGGFNARITYGADRVRRPRVSLIASMRYDPEPGYVLAIIHCRGPDIRRPTNNRKTSAAKAGA